MKLTLPTFIAILAACFLAAPAQAQTSNPPVAYTFSVDIIQGNLTVLGGTGQTLYTANDLAVSTELSSNVENMFATNTNEDTTTGFPPFVFPPYVQNNLPQMIAPGLSDYDFVINGTTFTNLPDYSPTIPPGLFLNSQGVLSTLPPLATFPLGTFLSNTVTPDLLSNDPFSFPISSTSTQTAINIFDFPVFDPSGVQEVDANVDVSYDTYNIVEVAPESRSLVLMVIGLAGLGLFMWTCRRRVKQK